MCINKHIHVWTYIHNFNTGPLLLHRLIVGIIVLKENYFFIYAWMSKKPQTLMHINELFSSLFVRGVQPFGISALHWKKKSCLRPHIKYIVIHNHKKSHVLSKFMILCWATCTAILSCMWPVGRRLHTPDKSNTLG